MTIHLTCPEDVFQASTPEQFLIAVESYSRPLVPPLLTDCVRNLCAETPDPTIIDHLHQESALNLFTIATAIHVLIFHQLRAFSPSPLATSSLSGALRRWKSAWMDSIENFTSSDSWGKTSQECAFFHRAREFALLAQVHIEKLHLSTEEWNELVKNLSEEVSEESGEFLATFDQTDMDHVAGLMLAIENLDLN
ncbi:hypothetical protein N7540_010314 [Penicillium herquei]|nr:hypothetical protein N7540_010314 [Penicillium herquei]